MIVVYSREGSCLNNRVPNGWGHWRTSTLEIFQPYIWQRWCGFSSHLRKGRVYWCLNALTRKGCSHWRIWAKECLFVQPLVYRYPSWLMFFAGGQLLDQWLSRYHSDDTKVAELNDFSGIHISYPPIYLLYWLSCHFATTSFLLQSDDHTPPYTLYELDDHLFFSPVRLKMIPWVTSFLEHAMLAADLLRVCIQAMSITLIFVSYPIACLPQVPLCFHSQTAYISISID
jgi:hypothetical protein